MLGPNLYEVRYVAQGLADEHSEALAVGTLSLKELAEIIESAVIQKFGDGMYVAAVKDICVPFVLRRSRKEIESSSE